MSCPTTPTLPPTLNTYCLINRGHLLPFPLDFASLETNWVVQIFNYLNEYFLLQMSG